MVCSLVSEGVEWSARGAPCRLRAGSQKACGPLGTRLRRDSREVGAAPSRAVLLGTPLGAAAEQMALPRPPPEHAPAVVTLGVDPHKASHTAAVLDAQQQGLARLRVPSTRAGYQAWRRGAARGPPRRWAVENAAGLGRPLAQWLLGDGQPGVAVPAKL